MDAVEAVALSNELRVIVAPYLRVGALALGADCVIADAIIAIIAREVAAARPFIAAEWQPIETAPKDGSNILIIAGTAYSPQARVGWWRGDGFAFYSRPDKPSGGGVTIMLEAAHWQPLPAPPTAIKETIR